MISAYNENKSLMIDAYGKAASQTAKKLESLDLSFDLERDTETAHLIMN